MRRVSWCPGAEARKEAEKLLEESNLLSEIVNTIGDLGVVGERPLVALAYLVATSRLLESPLRLLVRGSSGSGKSFILRTLCQVFPPEMVETVICPTPEFFYRISNFGVSLKNRVLFLDGKNYRQKRRKSFDSALQELHETGSLSRLLSVEEGGRFKTVRIVIEGAPAVLETAPSNVIPPEDLSRTILAWTDESEALTREVLRDFAHRKATGGPKVPPERLEALWAVQWLLEPCEVRIPFLSELAERFPVRSFESKRIFVHLVAITESLVLLRQRQRRREGSCVLAEEVDIRLAWRLLRFWLRSQLEDGIPPEAFRIWEAIRCRKEELTQSGLVKLGFGNGAVVHQVLCYLERMGAISFLGSAPGEELSFRVVNPDWEFGFLF